MIKIVNPDAAGIDIGKDELYVCIPRDRDEPALRRFGTYTDDVQALAKWLVSCKITTVAMESTGVYWIPIYDILTQYGIEMCLVNAKHLKNVPGRKSDVRDSEWLMDLHMVGLLRASFIPDEGIVKMRSYWRHREGLVEQRATHIQRMQKALTQMNIRLTEVITDVAGVTGMRIIRAIADGQTNPDELLKHRNRQCKATPEQFVKALTGNYREEHVFVLRQVLALYYAYSEQISLCEKQLEAHINTLKSEQNDDDDNGNARKLDRPRKNSTHSKNAPSFDVRGSLIRMTGVDLTSIDGLHASTAQTIISEIGTDMSRWPSCRKFASWLGLSPKNDITGGKVRKSRTLPGNHRASQAFKLGAQSLLKSKSALGAQARYLRGRLGPAQAITAIAHKLARIVYTMLKNKTPFEAASAEDYDSQQRDRLLKSMNKRAKSLGLQLVPI